MKKAGMSSTVAIVIFFKQKTAYELRISDWSSDVCSSDLSAIARKALKRKTGARGLRTIVESVLLDTMYDLPSLENVSKVVVDESVIEHKSDPYLIYQTPPAASPKVAAGE